MSGRSHECSDATPPGRVPADSLDGSGPAVQAPRSRQFAVGLAAAVAVLAALLAAPSPGASPGASPAAVSAHLGAAAPSGSVLTSREHGAEGSGLAVREPDAAWTPTVHLYDLAAVQDLLDERAEAVIARDVDAFAATASEQGTARVTARVEALALAQLPVTHWSYTLGADGTAEVVDTAATASARSSYGRDVVVARATLQFRLDEYDRGIVTSSHLVTVAREAAGWKVLDEAPADGARMIWQAGPLQMVQGRRSLVVGLGSGRLGRATLETYADAADAAVAEVTGVWGHDWQQRVLVVAPSTVDELSRLLRRPRADYRQIAAVTTASQVGVGAVSRGDRVFLNPRAFARLGPLSREILLRHEIAHVATVAAAADSLPTWLEEGFADYVGYRGSGLDGSVVAKELAAWVESGGRPRALPADEAFGGTEPDLVLAYDQAWVAAALVADRWGESALVRLYREAVRRSIEAAGAGAGVPTGEDAVAGAVRQVLGLPMPAFVRAWRTQVRALAGRA